MRTVARITGSLLSALCAACGGGADAPPPTPVPPAVATVAVTPDSVSIRVGETATMQAVARSSTGAPLAGRAVTWNSDQPTIASVSTDNGVVTAVSPGRAAVTARIEGVIGRAVVVVPAFAAANVQIVPASFSLAVGDTARVQATVRAANGSALAGRTVAWGIDPPTVATISASGLVTALAQGAATIRAQVEAVVGSASVTVAPVPVARLHLPLDATTLQVGITRQFPAVTRNAAGGAITGRLVDWRSSAPTVASVSTAGVVTAATVGTALIVATSEGRSDTLSVGVIDVGAPGVQPASAPDYRFFEPRVFDLASPPDTMLITLWPGATAPSTVNFVPLSGAPVPFQLQSGGRYLLRVPASIITRDYLAGNRHVHIGYFDIMDGNTRRARLNAVISVRTSEMPDVPVTLMSPGMQRSARILNVRLDTLLGSMGMRAFGPAASGSVLIDRLGSIFPDEIDFLATIENAESTANRYFVAARNSITGVGVGLLTPPAGSYGGLARLTGHFTFPFSAGYDMAALVASHEIGHHVMSYVPGFASGSHWRTGDLAFGIMGFAIAGSNAGGTFNYRIREPIAGQFRWECQPPAARGFNAIELYMLGLLPRDSVRETFFMQDVDPSTIVCNSALATAPRRITVDSIIAALGGVVRPAATRRELRVVTVAYSLGRLLTRSEMAFLEHMAARGEASTELASDDGIVFNQRTLPWRPATGGRSTLTMVLPLAPPIDQR